MTLFALLEESLAGTANKGLNRGCHRWGPFPPHQLTPAQAIICPPWPHFVSYLTSCKYCPSVTCIDLRWKSNQRLSGGIPQRAGRCLSASFCISKVNQRCGGYPRSFTPRCDECLWLSLKADQVALQRSSASQAQTSLWFDVCISVWLPSATHSTVSKLIIYQ